MRTVTAQRALIAAGDARPRIAARLFRAAWVEDQDISDDAVLARLCAEAGAPDLVAQARTPAIKQALIDETGEARDAGVFGTPTCVVDDPAGSLLFWGQDRLELVGAAAAGWRPRVG